MLRIDINSDDFRKILKSFSDKKEYCEKENKEMDYAIDLFVMLDGETYHLTTSIKEIIKIEN